MSELIDKFDEVLLADEKGLTVYIENHDLTAL